MNNYPLLNLVDRSILLFCLVYLVGWTLPKTAFTSNNRMAAVGTLDGVEWPGFGCDDEGDAGG